MGISYRRTRQDLADVQRGNAEWWTHNPMTYDWPGSITASPHTVEWFQAIDRRSIQASYPYVSENRPFDRIFPPDLVGRRVLEIGCGMGLHTAELAKRGADVTAIELTLPAVEATLARLASQDLNATVMQHDAERLPFEDDQFDQVWSWGVIRHSAQTGCIVGEISRVLRAGGETRIMVYNREALVVRLVLLRHYLVGRGYRTKTPDEVLWEHTDGYFAPYYTQDQIGDLFRTFFDNVKVEILGHEVDVVPLPGALRARLGAWLSEQRRREIAARRGGFLFVTTSEPN